MKTLSFSAVIPILVAFGCSAPQHPIADCPTTSESSAVSRVPVAIDFKTVAGGAPFTLGSTATTQDGSEYKVSKLRFYLSDATLVDTRNVTVSAPLADRDGKRLPYGVALVDYAKPETLKLSLLAPLGDYKAINLMVGVPDRCASGESLAHGDAAERVAPLDVDSDMYWAWNPSYVSFKIEGQVRVEGKFKPFFYHVGEDARRAKLHVHVPLHVNTEQRASAALAVDINKLFMTPAGDDNPRLEPQRMHNGPLADQMAVNISKSGFVAVAK